MKISPRTSFFSIAWLLTLTVGFLIGRQTNPPQPDQPQSGTGQGSSGLLSGSQAAPHRGQATSTRPGARASESTPRPSPERTLAKLTESLRLSDRLSRTRRLLDLAETLSPEEFPAVIEAFRADGLARIRGTEYSLLLTAWTKADPFGAAEYMESSDDSGHNRETVIAAWAAMDPQGAAAWIEGRKDGGSVNNWTIGLLRGVASNDPNLALQHLEALDPGRTRSSAMQAVVPYVLQNGFDYTADWVASIDNEDLQRGTARQLARDLTRLDANQAGAWIKNMSSVPSRRDASEIVSDQWARKDLESARQWAEALPEDTRTEAAEGVARHMARQDPERTATWLNSLGTNPDLDGARRIFIYESANRAPQVALENVYTLSRSSEQEKMYHHVLKEWSRKNSDAVKTWVAYNVEALPSSVVKRYVPKPGKPRKN